MDGSLSPSRSGPDIRKFTADTRTVAARKFPRAFTISSSDALNLKLTHFRDPAETIVFRRKPGSSVSLSGF